LNYNNNNWAYIIYNKYAHLELPFLEEMIPQSKKEVNGICRILKKHKISKGGRILDFYCGIGRHSIEIAKRGFQVVGYDPSRLYIDYAKNWAQKQDHRVRSNLKFIHGDPVRIPSSLSTTKFDAVIIMGSSIGFVSEKIDHLVMKNLAKIIKFGAILILEVENRDWSIGNFQSHGHRESESIEAIHEWKFNYESSETNSKSKFYKRINNDKRHLQIVLELEVKLRLYSLHEIIKLLNNAGWSYLTSYENILNHIPVRNRSQYMIIVGSNRIQF
jgi:D-alanine-D-alanine ligase